MNRRIILSLALALLLLVLSVSPVSASINTEKAFETDTYDAYGILIQDSPETLLYIYRSGLSPSDKGKIVKRSYNIQNDTWGEQVDVYVHPEYNATNVGGGVIGERVFVFMTLKYPDSWNDMKLAYIYSENLTDWGEPQEIEVSITPSTSSQIIFCPYGNITPTDNLSVFLQPLYYTDKNYEFHGVGYVKTTDCGDTWVACPEKIYCGNMHYTETDIEYSGNGTLVALMRNKNLAYLAQSVSTDNGDNWTTPSLTNLGGIVGEKIPDLIYSGNLTVVYHDRGDGYTKVSENGTAWTESVVISPKYHVAGYPSTVKLSPTEYFIVFSAGTYLADIWQCKYVTDNNTQVNIEPFVDKVPPPKPTIDSGGGGGGVDPSARGAPLTIRPTSDPNKFIVRMDIDGRILQRILTKAELDELLKIYTLNVEKFVEKYGMSEKAALDTAKRYKENPRSEEFKSLTKIERQNLLLITFLVLYA